MGAGAVDKYRERERESGSDEGRRHRKEGVIVMLLRDRTKEKKAGQ